MRVLELENGKSATAQQLMDSNEEVIDLEIISRTRYFVNAVYTDDQSE